MPSGYTAKERLYLNSKGEVVKGDDPDKQSLLVGVNGTVPTARARELGLMEEPDEEEPQGRGRGQDPDRLRGQERAEEVKAAAEERQAAKAEERAARKAEKQEDDETTAAEDEADAKARQMAAGTKHVAAPKETKSR